MIYQVRFLQWKIRIHRRNVIFCFNWLLLDFQRLSRQMIFVINFFTLIQCTGIGLWLFRIVFAFMRHNIVGFHLNIRTTPPITFKCRFAIVCSKCRVRKISSEIFKFFNPFLPFFNNFFILFIIDIQFLNLFSGLCPLRTLRGLLIVLKIYRVTLLQLGLFDHIQLILNLMTFLMNFAFNHFLFDFSLVLRVKIFISIFIFFIVLLLLDQNPLMNAGLSNRAVFLFLRIIFLALRRRIPMKDFIHTRLPASHI